MPRPSAKKSKSPVALISWIVGFLVVAVAALILFSEMGARQQCDFSYEAIGAAIAKKQISREQVGKLLDGSPERRMDKKNRRESFTWSGTLGSYAFIVEYDPYGDVDRIQPQ